MNKKASAAIPILVVLIVLVLSLAGGIFYLLQKEWAEKLTLQSELESVRAQYRKAESELQDAKRKNYTLDAQLKESQEKLDALTDELQKEKAATNEALVKIERMTAELEQQKGARLDLENKLLLAQEDMKKTQQHVKDIESQKTELESKVKEMETKSQNIELGKIVVGPESVTSNEVATVPEQAAQAVKKGSVNASKPSTQDGKVLVVNKDYSFAVINLGSKDGVNIGDEFSVYHKDKYIGDIKIEKIHDSMAAAGFMTEDIKGKINEGDKIIEKAK